MSEINSFPNNQDEYIGAESVMRWFHGRTRGVFGTENNCAVTAVQDTMAVNVSDGTGWHSNDNADGVVWWIDNMENTGEKLRLDVDVADGVLDRIDRVVVTWETTNYVARPTVEIIKGTASSTPVPPALTNNSTVRQLSLARIHIPAGVLSIDDTMITDERTDASVCGIVTESVSVDTSMIDSKMNAALEKVESEASATLSDTRQQATAVLESIELELNDLQAGVAVELKKLQFNNIIVPDLGFIRDNTFEDAGYGYRAAVSLTGVISSMIPEVVFSMEDSISGNFAPVAETYNGGIYLYAAAVPEDDIIIPTILCWRGA